MDERTFCSWAGEMGFAQVGFCAADEFAGAREAVSRQAPLAERKQLRFAPREDEPETRSLAVLLWPYAQAEMTRDEAVFVDSYYPASNAAYHAAKKLEQRMTAAGRFARANVSYPAKEAAVRAGLGVIGQNSLLITPQYGTRVVIILMATDMEHAQEGERGGRDAGCLSCGRCASACPAGAIDDQGMTHPERCLRNYMMEGNVTPEPVRSRIGMRLLGCDICQRVCPMQNGQTAASPVQLHLDELVTLDAGAFSQAVARLAEQIGRNAARPQRVRAQAALLAGNSRNPAYLPVLQEWAQSPFEAVRVHALWAMEQMKWTDTGLDRTGKTG